MSNVLHNYSVSLILNSSDAELVDTLSKELNLNFGEFIPHVTVCTFAKQPDLKVDKKIVNTMSTNLYFSTDSKERIWVGLSIQKTDSLIELYRATCDAANLSADVDAYFPHVTLGCLGKNELEQVDRSNMAEASKRLSFNDCRLAFCKNGELGKVVEVLS